MQARVRELPRRRWRWWSTSASPPPPHRLPSVRPVLWASTAALAVGCAAGLQQLSPEVEPEEADQAKDGADELRGNLGTTTRHPHRDHSTSSPVSVFGRPLAIIRPGELEENLAALTDYFKELGARIRRASFTREGRTMLGLIALNTVVYLGWKLRPGGPQFMWRHFACSLESLYAGRTHTLFTSSISHMGLLHLMGNMFLLANFGMDVCKAIGSSRFLILYAGGALASSLVSLLYKRVRLSGAVSVGASGSVMAILVMFAMLFPRSSLYVMGVKMTAQEACLLWVLFDVAGVVGRLGYIDFAAHLGGALFGYAYHRYIEERLREERELRRRARRWGLGDRAIDGAAGSSSGGLLGRLDALLEWLQTRRDPKQRRAVERVEHRVIREEREAPDGSGDEATSLSSWWSGWWRKWFGRGDSNP